MAWHDPNYCLLRGAGASKGRTSWQAKAETDDYISFAGFFIHYVEGLRARPSPMSPTSLVESSLTPVSSAQTFPSSPIDKMDREWTLVLGGYSYGSLIAGRLPATQDLLKRFEKASQGSAESEIKLRAANLAAQWNKDTRLYLEAHCPKPSGSRDQQKAPTHSMAVVMGGEEFEASSRRPSHERRSLDAIRKSVDRSRRRLGSRQHSHNSYKSNRFTDQQTSEAAPIPLPQTCYLLISPLMPPISMLATMFSSIRADRRCDCGSKVKQNQMLAIFGDSDAFSSQKKLRRWAEGLQATPGSQFQFREVAGAGHFWREDGSDSQMRKHIQDWLHGVLDDRPSAG